MKLLLDNNLSPRLAHRLADLGQEIVHVESAGLASATDLTVWDLAKRNGLMIVTKDSDFSEIQVLQGFPPKVIWIRLGNCTTNQVELLIRNRMADLSSFEADPSAGMLLLS